MVRAYGPDSEGKIPHCSVEGILEPESSYAYPPGTSIVLFRLTLVKANMTEDLAREIDEQLSRKLGEGGEDTRGSFASRAACYRLFSLFSLT